MKHTVLLVFTLGAFSALAQSSTIPGSTPGYSPQPYGTTNQLESGAGMFSNQVG